MGPNGELAEMNKSIFLAELNLTSNVAIAALVLATAWSLTVERAIQSVAVKIQMAA